jgi:hypothetical protein
MKCVLTVTALGLGVYIGRECWRMSRMNIYELADYVRGRNLPFKLEGPKPTSIFQVGGSDEEYDQAFLDQVTEVGAIHYAFNHTLYQRLKTPESRDAVFMARFQDRRSEEEIFEITIDLVKKENPKTWKSLNLEQHTRDYYYLLGQFRKRESDSRITNKTHDKV